MGHIPVLLTDVMEAIGPIQEGVIVDATFGGGGYTEAVFKAKPNVNVIAFDKDPDAIKRGASLQLCYPDRLKIIHDSFSTIDQYISERVEVVMFDFGVSSYQLDEGERGFSFQYNGPLDMRMDPAQPLTASHVVNTYKESELADIIYTYGDETKSRIIAKAIIAARHKKPLLTTFDLVEVIHGSIGKGGKTNSATKTFQALRIFVNDELRDIEKGLKAACRVLKEQGRLITVAFHSLEDRVVKNTLKNYIQKDFFESLTKHVCKPSLEEIRRNSRARSARMRTYVCVKEVQYETE